MCTFSPLLSPVLQVVLVPEDSCYSSSVAASPTWRRQTNLFFPSNLFILIQWIMGSGRSGWKGGIKRHSISLCCPDTCISIFYYLAWLYSPISFDAVFLAACGFVRCSPVPFRSHSFWNMYSLKCWFSNLSPESHWLYGIIVSQYADISTADFTLV